jgi:hypothetical protein
MQNLLQQPVLSFPGKKGISIRGHIFNVFLKEK